MKGRDHGRAVKDTLTAWLADDPNNRDVVSAALQEARERTWQLVEPLPDDLLTSAATDYLSPPVWDLGHMANFEERWLVQYLLDCEELREGFNDIYNAFKHARKDRPNLRLLDREGVRKYMQEVRQRALDVLERIQPGDDPCTQDLFIHWMLVLHEHQHQETLLQTLQMHGPDQYSPSFVRQLPTAQGPLEKAWLMIPEGEFTMGIKQTAGVYDNESPPTPVDVPAFRMARYPVTCGEFLAFVQGNGYQEEANWSPRGWQWVQETQAAAPLYWEEREGAWHRRSVLGWQSIEAVADEILCHVSYFEAEAYAKWLGARLPTEAEWEKAARLADQGPIRNPWGNDPAHVDVANIDQLAWQPSTIGSHPRGASATGCEHMVGDVWEWTSSDFHGYPGFEAFPYPEYSEVFFGGDYKVLRGGSWATRAGCATGTFRNWDHPYRRQIFAGIRLARDA